MSVPAAGRSRVRRLQRRARQYLDSGQLDAAQAALESLTQHLPGDASVRMELADVLLARGHMQAGVRQLQAAAPHLPNDPLAIARLAHGLFVHGDTLGARRCFAHPEVARTRSGQGLVSLARARSLLDEPPATLALLERALAAGVDTPDEHFSMALQLQSVGRLDAAATALETCIRRWPEFSGAAMTLMRLRRQDDARHLDYLQRQVRRIPGDNIVHAEFQFALYKLLTDLEQHERAWDALARGNAVMHKLLPYDGDAEAAVMAATVGRQVADGPAHPPASPENPQPIFVVGLPRSGTTLLERMLSNHSQVATAGELSDLPRQLRRITGVPGLGLNDFRPVVERCGDLDTAALGRRYLEQTRWRAGGKRYYIDKLPNNYLFVDLIHSALPQAPILLMQRAAMDVCFSNFKAMFGMVSAYSYALPTLAHFHGLYRQLVAHWHERLPDVMLTVDYADLVRTPEAVLQRVLAHCGLTLEPACLTPGNNPAPVSTPSSAQVREPVHARGLGEWKHHARHLQPLRDALDTGGQ